MSGFLLTHEAPSSKGALVETHWSRVYTEQYMKFDVSNFFIKSKIQNCSEWIYTWYSASLWRRDLWTKYVCGMSCGFSSLLTAISCVLILINVFLDYDQMISQWWRIKAPKAVQFIEVSVVP